MKTKALFSFLVMAIVGNIIVPMIVLLLMAIFTPPLHAEEPQPTINVPCKVVDVYDGDTVTVRVTFDIRVRLLDCWAPEVKTKDKEEKARGIESRQRMKELAEGKQGLLVVPLSDADRLDDIFTFGRLLGRIYIEGNPQDVSSIMVRDGFATKTKQPKEMEVDP